MAYAYSPFAYNVLKYGTLAENAAYKYAPVAAGAFGYLAKNYFKNKTRNWGRQHGLKPIIKREAKKAVANACPRKWFDTTVSGTITNTDDCFTHLDVIPVGVDCNERVGRNYTIRNIQISAVIRAGTDQTTPQMIKFVLLLDKEAHEAKPVWTDVYSALNPHAPFGKENVGRFQVLASREVVCIGDGDTASGQTTLSKFPLKMFYNKPIKVNTEVSDITGVIANRRGNAIHFGYICDTAASGSTASVISAYVRVSYTDE